MASEISKLGRPDLLLIDGGKGQLSAAIKARDERGIKLPIISIAKREEEIIIHKTGSQIDVTRIEELQKSIHRDIAIHEDNDAYVVNLHPAQRTPALIQRIYEVLLLTTAPVGTILQKVLLRRQTLSNFFSGFVTSRTDLL